MAKKKIPQGLDEDDRRYIEEKMYGKSSDKYSLCNPVNYNYKCNFKAKNALQKEFWNNLKSKSVVSICEGPAGTGKSYIALSYALKAYLDGRFNKINIIVPNVEASSITIGLLPGGVDEKLQGWFYEIKDTLEVILENSGNMNPKATVEGLIRNGIIEISNTSFIRGRNFRGLTIINEAQNFTPEEVFLILTRLSSSGKRTMDDEFESGKMIIIGDRTQSDRKDIRKDYHNRCGIVYAIDHLNGMEDVDIVEFTSDMVVRNPFITKLIKRWDMTTDEIEKELNDNKNTENVDEKVEELTDTDIEVPKKKCKLQ